MSLLKGDSSNRRPNPTVLQSLRMESFKTRCLVISISDTVVYSSDVGLTVRSSILNDPLLAKCVTLLLSAF